MVMLTYNKQRKTSAVIVLQQHAVHIEYRMNTFSKHRCSHKQTWCVDSLELWSLIGFCIVSTDVF